MRNLRNLVVPALALLVFVRLVLEWPQDRTASRLIESVFWVLLLYALLGVVNDLVFGRGEPVEGRPRWTDKVPKLFRDLVRALLVAIGAMVVYSRLAFSSPSRRWATAEAGDVIRAQPARRPVHFPRTDQSR